MGLLETLCARASALVVRRSRAAFSIKPVPAVQFISLTFTEGHLLSTHDEILCTRTRSFSSPTRARIHCLLVRDLFLPKDLLRRSPVRPHIGAALATHRADEEVLDVGRPHVIRPPGGGPDPYRVISPWGRVSVSIAKLQPVVMGPGLHLDRDQNISSR